MSAGFTSTDTGMFVRVPAWHRIGNVPTEYPGSWAEARKFAELEWDPTLAPLFGFKGIKADLSVSYDPADATAGDYFAEQGKVRIIRSDNGYTLGVAGSGYTVINHTELGEILEAVLGTGNTLQYDTLFSLYGGKLVCCAVKLDEPIQVRGDASLIYPYVALTAKHDGEGAVRLQSTSVRAVCQNTISMAEAQADRSGTVFSFRHSGAWRDRIDEAKLAMTGVRRDFARFGEIADVLARTPITTSIEDAFVALMVPEPPAGLISTRVHNNVARSREQLRACITGTAKDGDTTAGTRGTAFGLWQASVEYLDHYRRARTLDSYAARTLLNRESMKTSALAVIRELVKG